LLVAVVAGVFVPKVSTRDRSEKRMARRAAAQRSDLISSFNKARTLHRDGRLTEASLIYDAILSENPQNFDALHLSGVLKHQQGDGVEGLRRVAAALRSKPGTADVLMSHGVILDALKRHDEALLSFDSLLARSTNDPVLHYNRGNALKALGRHDEALTSFGRALELAPDLAVAHHNMGSAYAEIDRNGEALTCYDRALELALTRAGIGSTVSAALSNSDGFKALDRAFAADPDTVSVLSNRGKILLRLKRFEEAIASFNRTLAINQLQPDALCFRGDAFAELGLYDAAFADYERALQLAPNSPDAHLKRGNAFVALNLMDRALQSYLAVQRIQPENADAHFNEALTRLCLGNFREGWRKYECRWDRKEFANERPTYPRPIWQGEKNIEGKTILLVTEQGFGDAIQFVRYAPMVAALGARVLLGVRSPLAALMKGVPGIAGVFAGGETLPHFDLYCPLLSLPLAFGTELASIPSAVPYIRAPIDRVAAWRSRMPDNGRLRVGVCWSGTGAHLNNRRRSISLDSFAPVLSVAGINFVSLQKDVSETEAALLHAHGVHQLGQDFADFADTVAVVAMLDLVISVDTSVAHLAGAMAKATAVLLPFSPDFRWLLDRTDSPWYPTMRLFRQKTIGDWNGPVEQLRQELLGVAARRST
jgi:tetratricopeptide (TPR) repeat protein